MQLYPFRYRDPLTDKWVRGRNVAERHEIAGRYKEWKITGPPEIREPVGGLFRPYLPAVSWQSNVHRSPSLTSGARYLVLLSLRRYIRYCARRGRCAQMEGAARLFAEVRQTG